MNKLYSLLLFVFAYSMITLSSKTLLLSGVFLPLVCLAFFWKSYNGHFVVDIELFSSLEYFFNSIFPLKVSWVALVFCHLAGLLCPTEATFTLDVGALLSSYLLRETTTVSNSFSYLSGCTLTVVAAVDNL